MADTKVSALTAATDLVSADIAGQQGGTSKRFGIALWNAVFQPLASALTSWASVVRASGFDTFVATPSSANLAALVTDETGTGALVLAASPALSGTPTAPTAGGGTNTTQIATTAFVTTAVAAVSASYTFLGTITTTSGASQSLSGLTLTNYKFLKCMLNGVSLAAGVSFTQNGTTIGTLTAGAGAVSGVLEIDLNTGAGFFVSGGSASTTAISGGYATGITTASTAITVATGSTFDAGSIRVYAI